MRAISFSLKSLRRFLGEFRHDVRGSYAIIFGIALIPILLGIGSAIDLSQAYIVKQRMTRALDDAGLAVGTQVGLTNAQLQQAAQYYFDANFPSSKLGIPGTVTVTSSGAQIALSVAATMPTSIMGIIGVNTLKISASSQITKMGKKLEVALVLDNTGSMSQNNKLTTLKVAAKDLISTVSASALNLGDVKVAIVPFTTDVNVGTANSSASWLKWSYSDPVTTCSWWGGCSTYTQTTTVSSSSWKGCVTDRDQSYDETTSVPYAGDSATLYPADTNKSSNSYCGLQSISPLSTDWSALDTKIDNMVAGGNTNTTIGMIWGGNVLLQGNPLSNAAAADPQHLDKVIVYLTDGQNTQDRWYSCGGSGTCTSIDDRMDAACTYVKAQGILVYTIRVMDGNEALLKSCATSPDMYYSVTNASQLTTVFNTIAQQLSNLRVSK